MPVSQAYWCNMTLQLVFSSSLIDETWVKQPPEYEADDKLTELSLLSFTSKPNKVTDADQIIARILKEVTQLDLKEWNLLKIRLKGSLLM